MANWRMCINGSGDEDATKLLAVAQQLKSDGQDVTGANINITGEDYALDVAADGTLSLPA